MLGPVAALGFAHTALRPGTDEAPELRHLRGGTRVAVHVVEPLDKDGLTNAFQRLSPESRHQRFLGGIARLNDSLLRYFTEVDHVNHEAWVAFDPDLPGWPLVGIGRYVRLEKSPDVAEVAVTVVDSHQGRGIGTLLLGLIARSAAENGVATFRAYAFATNAAMLRILRDLGAQVRRVDCEVLCLDVPVVADPARLPDTPTGRAFKAIAEANERVT